VFGANRATGMHGFCAALIWALAAAPVSAQELALALKSNATQDGSTLPLQAVAGGATTAQATLELPLKGRVGDTVVYTRAELGALIERRLPGARLRWSGAERVLVYRRGQALAAGQYVAWAQERLQSQLAGSEGRFEIAPIGDYRDLNLPGGAVNAKAHFDAGVGRRETRVWLDLLVDGNFYTTVPVQFRVRHFLSALVLLQTGTAHLPLGAAQVEQREVDVSEVRGAALRAPQQLAGMRLRHDVAAGVALSEEDIELRPPVRSGSEIQVFATVGSIVVQTGAVAQRDGFIGQRIGAWLPKNNEQLMVEVIGEDRAIVSNTQR